MSRSGNKMLEEIAKSLPSDDQIKKQVGELRENLQAAGIEARHLGARVPEQPDCPPCDYCGKEFEGNLICSSCHCVAYCSRGCQKAHWKLHKTQCSTMDEQCEEAARRFVGTIADSDCHISRKFDSSLWVGLDGSSPYKKAMAIGLNAAIEQLLKEESELFLQRVKVGILGSFTQMLMCTLFRNGRHIPGGAFSGIDAYRIKKYVRSSENAFPEWFKASMTVITYFTSIAAASSPRRHGQVDPYFWQVQGIARDIAAGWSMVFTSTKASKAILLGESKEPDDVARERVKWILAQLKLVLASFPQESPDRSAVEGQTNQFTAMIELRCEEFGIDNLGSDFPALLGLKRTKKQMYNDVAIPYAQATMAKGRNLTNDEGKQALLEHARSGGSRRTATGGAGGGGSNKKKGKKGKKGRR